MTDNGFKISSMVKEKNYGQMGRSIRVNIMKVKKKGRENFFGLMVVPMRGSFIKMKFMEMEFINGKKNLKILYEKKRWTRIFWLMKLKQNAWTWNIYLERWKKI